MTRTGACACGAIRFTARGEPRRVALCHCMTCRRTHGAPFGAFVVYAETDVDVVGTAAVWKAGPTYERCFCSTCGSRVFGRENEEIELSLGCFDDVGAFTPTYECWTEHREPWLPASGIAQYTRGRTP